MTIRDLIQLAGQHPITLVAAFLVPPLAAWLLGQMRELGRGREAPWKSDFFMYLHHPIR
jgi:hypothetical protein